jgi:hypothetical protein
MLVLWTLDKKRLCYYFSNCFLRILDIRCTEFYLGIIIVSCYLTRCKLADSSVQFFRQCIVSTKC